MKKIAIVVLAVGLLSLGCKGNTGGEETLIFVDINAANSLQEGTEANPFLTIQDAVDCCETTVSNKRCEIRVAEGTYNESVIATNETELIRLKGGYATRFDDWDPQTYDTIIESLGYVGILWENPGDLEVEGFQISGNFTGIGTFLDEGGNVLISDNLISDNDLGILNVVYPPYPLPTDETVPDISASLTASDNLLYNNYYIGTLSYAIGYDTVDATLEIDLNHNSVYGYSGYSYAGTILGAIGYYNGGAHVAGEISNNIVSSNNVGLGVQSGYSYSSFYVGDSSVDLDVNNNIVAFNYIGIGLYTLNYDYDYTATVTLDVDSTNDTVAYNYLFGALAYELGVGTAESDIQVNIRNDIFGYAYGLSLLGNVDINDDILVNYSLIDTLVDIGIFPTSVGNIDEDPLFENVPDMMEPAGLDDVDTIAVDSASPEYDVDDIIEINFDGVSRTVTAVDDIANTVEFTPPVPEDMPGVVMVLNYGADGSAGVNLNLAVGSPCINTGDPSISDIDGTRSDMGAYGGPGGEAIGTRTW